VCRGGGKLHLSFAVANELNRINRNKDVHKNTLGIRTGDEARGTSRLGFILTLKGDVGI